MRHARRAHRHDDDDPNAHTFVLLTLIQSVAQDKDARAVEVYLLQENSPNSGQIESILAKSGCSLPILGPNLVSFEPTLADSGPTLADSWPILVDG